MAGASPGEGTWDGSWHGSGGFLELGELFGGEKGKSWSESGCLGSSFPGIAPGSSRSSLQLLPRAGISPGGNQGWLQVPFFPLENGRGDTSVTRAEHLWCHLG